MLNGIIRMAAVLLTLLLAGCSKTFDPTPGQNNSICFGAGSVLLRDATSPATKSGTIKDTFDQASDDVGVAAADSFFVWGRKIVSAVPSAVFAGDKVTLKNLGSNASDPSDDVWTYTNSRFWDTGASYYDFLAFSGAPLSAVSCNPALGGSLTATVAYDPTVNQYDILAAFYQRAKGNAATISTSTVHMPFQHVLSAVSVTIYNDTPNISTPDITLNAYTFRNIVTNSTGTISQDGNALAELTTTTWSSQAHNGLSTGVLGDSSGPHVITPSAHYPTTVLWDLMIPQDLEPFGNYTPQLYLDYEYTHVNPYTSLEEDVHAAFGINLEEIHVKNSDDFITSWEPGKKYTYEIHIRLGGGVNVTVNVTDWEEVIAETTGVTITQ